MPKKFKNLLSPARSAARRSHFVALGRKLRRWAQRSAAAARQMLSIKGAAIITAVAVLISVVQLLVAVQGKLVILPLEVRSDQSVPSELGASFSASLAVALNEYRSLFPSMKEGSDRELATSKNYFDLVQSFMSDLPFVEIPRSSHLNKGATVLEALKVGPISIPVSQIVFENLPVFHRDTLRGSLEVWGNDLTARISIGSKSETILSVSVPKDQGYRALINRVTVELLLSKSWISPIPMKLSALTLFSEGLRDYLRFDLYGEEKFIQSAREKYDAALQLDRNADLARLHLGATQYISTEPALIAKAIENFSVLLANPRFNRAARIGYVASSLRYMERSGGCTGVYRFLVPTLLAVRSWETEGKYPGDLEELLLWSGAHHLTAGYLLPSNPCGRWIKFMLQGTDVENLFEKAKSGYAKALVQISGPGHYRDNVATRYRLYVLLREKYLLDDMVDYSLMSKKPNLAMAEAALKLGLDIQKRKEDLPEAQRRFFASSLPGSVSDSYLRIAKIRESDPETSRESIKAAIANLQVAASASEAITAQWALFRLADLELGQSNAGAALEWLMRAYRDHPESLPGIFEQSYFPYGALVEKPAQRCEAIKLLKRGSGAGSLASKLLLIDTLRRQGDAEGATELSNSLRAHTESSTKWIGASIGHKHALIEAKLTAKNREAISAEKLWSQFSSLGREGEFLKVDLFELASLIGDNSLLTKMQAEISFPPLLQSEIVKLTCD